MMLDLTTITVDRNVINKLYKSGEVKTDLVDPNIETEELFFVLFKTEDNSQSALAHYEGEFFVLVNTKDVSYQGFSPRDASQSCLFWALKELDLIVAIGGAGTGKTTVSMAYAIRQMYRADKSLVLCKPTVLVGRSSTAIGTIPGDHREKMAGYIDSYLTPLKKIFGSTFEHHLYEYEEEEKILFKPIELMRGQHFEDTILIIDEAQNTTPHELMSVISRAGTGCKVIVLGDQSQIDQAHPWNESGLYALVNSTAFQSCEFASGIRLTGQYRGPMATLAADVLTELHEINN